MLDFKQSNRITASYKVSFSQFRQSISCRLVPPPQTPPLVGRGTPPPHTPPHPLGASIVAPSARQTLPTQLKNTSRASAPAP